MKTCYFVSLSGSPLVLKGSVFGTLNGSTGEVYCKGNETAVLDCSYTAISCSSSNLAAVVCPSKPIEQFRINQGLSMS